ncbi:MAG TPA: O-antigen ligase family protein [Terriglobales bacterium]|nr:O-antigen ligase family protein [Terriglobales bacterium]
MTNGCSRSSCVGDGNRRCSAADTFWRPAAMLLALLACAVAFVPGRKYGALLLAGGIAALASVRPRTGLWASCAFLIFLFVFCQETLLVGFTLPAVYLYWGTGVALITGGLLLAYCRARGAGVTWATVTKVDRAVLLVFLVSVVAALYGMAQRNDGFAVARQFFGCLLLPTYYLVARRFLRSPEEACKWMRAVGWAVAVGAACYVIKLGFLTLALGSYYREQSAIGFYAGAVGAAWFAEMQELAPGQGRRWRWAGLAICGLAIILLGARFVAGSLAATVILFALSHSRRRHRFLPACAAGLMLGALILPGIRRLPDSSGTVGEIAARFVFPLDEDLSYLGRVAQWQSVLEVIREHPLLGHGMGGEFSYATEQVSWLSGTTTYVDNGWGFLLLKMGITGLAAFLLLAGTVAHVAWRSRSAGVVIQRARRPLLAVLIFGLLSFTGGPTFLHFTQAGFLGTALGALAGLSRMPCPELQGSAQENEQPD